MRSASRRGILGEVLRSRLAGQDRLVGLQCFLKDQFLFDTMLHHLGILLQIVAMTGLPLVIMYQLNFGFKLTIMPICTVAAIVVFYLGTRLREYGN